MKFWKSNRDIPDAEPAFPVPTFEDIKRYYEFESNFYLQNLKDHGLIRSGGWAFSFRDELKKYVVKCLNGMLFEMWAPNKTLLRKNVHYKISYILEIPMKYL